MGSHTPCFSLDSASDGTAKTHCLTFVQKDTLSLVTVGLHMDEQSLSVLNVCVQEYASAEFLFSEDAED